jgi:hypothetical protein
MGSKELLYDVFRVSHEGFPGIWKDAESWFEFDYTENAAYSAEIKAERASIGSTATALRCSGFRQSSE